MTAEASVQRVGRQACKLRMIHMEQRLMIARFHINLGLRFDGIVDDEVEPIAPANGWNCTVCAVAKQRINLAFIGYVDVATKLRPQIRKADVVRCRQDGEHVAAVAPQYDAFGQTITRYMAGFGGPRRR